MTGTALRYNEDTTLPEPFARGYMSPACNAELERDGATPVADGLDLTDWNASYGQIGGSMHSTLADLGTRVASMSGSSLLSDELAAQRLELHDAGLQVFDYGLGILTRLAHDVARPERIAGKSVKTIRGTEDAFHRLRVGDLRVMSDVIDSDRVIPVLGIVDRADLECWLRRR